MWVEGGGWIENLEGRSDWERVKARGLLGVGFDALAKEM